MPADPESPLYTLKEAAAYLNVSVRTFARLTAAGDIPSIYITTRPLFHRDDLDAYIRRAHRAARVATA